MRIIRYLSGQLLVLTLSVTLVLTLAIWLTQSLRFMSIILLQGIPFSTFLSLMLWILPDLLLLALPISFLMSVLFLYNKAAAEHELIILKTSGCSFFFLLQPIFWIGTGGTLLLYLISLYLMPLSLQNFREREISFRTKYSQAMIHEGEFTSLGAVVVYVDRYDSEGLVNGLLVYDNRNPEEPASIMAEKALIKEGTEELTIILLKGNRQTLGNTKHPPALLTFSQYSLSLLPKSPIIHTRKPYEMFLPELFSSNSPDPSEIEKFRAEGFQRLTMPLYMLCFGLLAGLFLLLSPETRMGRQKAMLGAVVVAFLIEMGSMFVIQSRWMGDFSAILGLGCVFLPLIFLIIFIFREIRAWKKVKKILSKRLK